MKQKTMQIGYVVAAILGFSASTIFAADQVRAKTIDAAKTPAKPAGSTRPSTAASEPVSIPQSVFTIPATLKEGRDPFFPNSKPEMPAIVPKPGMDWDAATFVLNGITSPPRRTAMINGRTFEVGEEGEVRLPSGSKVLIKCVEIGNSTAAIMVGGQRRELKMREGL
jgi:hypothetical protein